MAAVDDATTSTAPVATPNASPEKKSLTDREMAILSNVWQCLKSPPEIDVNKLAEMCGMSNPRSATNAWGTIKKKLFSITTPSPSPTKTPKAAGKRVAADIQDENAGSDATAKQTLPKKPRRAAAKKSAKPKPGPKKPVKEEVKADADSMKDELVEEDDGDGDSN